jgi:REP element-mobilizing transposase RayT
VNNACCGGGFGDFTGMWLGCFGVGGIVESNGFNVETQCIASLLRGNSSGRLYKNDCVAIRQCGIVEFERFCKFRKLTTMEKYQNKYRIASARANWWDYADPSAYFITICTLNFVHYFGEIANGQIQLNELGKVAHLEWLKTVELRPEMKLELGTFVVMPNHFHAILVIGENSFNQKQGDAGQISIERPMGKFAPQIKNLASVVRGFKSAVTTHARKKGLAGFAWQRRFHDRVIRDEAEFQRISAYIISNPENWLTDKFTSK